MARGLRGCWSADRAGYRRWRSRVVLRGPDEGQVRALVIGIDAYRNVRPLKGAVSDARDIEAALRRMRRHRPHRPDRRARGPRFGDLARSTGWFRRTGARRSGDALDRRPWRAGAGAGEGLAARRHGQRVPAARISPPPRPARSSASSGPNSTTSSSSSRSAARACCSSPTPATAAG